MSIRPAHRRGRQAGRRALRTLAVASVLVGAVAGCTDGGAAGTAPPGGGEPRAALSTAATDPTEDDVRSTGVALDADGVTVTAVAAGTVVTGSMTDADASVHLDLTLDGGTAPSATGGPLAWLTGPAGSTAAVLEDGSAVISAADGAFLVGLTAPTPSARFTVVGTPAAVLRIDRVTAGSLSATSPAARVTTSTWLSGTAVVAAVWGVADGGRSLKVTPSPWARTGTLAAQQALWSQLVAEHPDATSPSMHEQLLCHVLGAAGKPTWDIEPWRPQVDALTMLRTRCNPTAADATAGPAAGAPTAG